MADRFEFPTEDLEQRFIDHFSLAQSYAARAEEEFGVGVTVNVRALYLAVISAYKDIERYKNFHLLNPFEQRSDAVKRTAYLCKWLCRFKPLNVTSLGDLEIDNIEVDCTSILNELFAIHVCCLHLSVHVKRDFVIGAEKGYEIAYEMLFRQLSEDSFMLIFQLIVDQIKGNDIVIFT